MDFRINASQKAAGIIKQPFKLKTSRKDGLILQIHHTVPTEDGELHFKFMYVAFASTGEKLSAVDYRGNIFIVDLAHNRFWLLPNVDACSVLAFSPIKENNLLVGTYNCDIKIYDVELGTVSGTLGGHTAPPKQISYSSDGCYCLTAAGDDAIIWNLQSNVQAHRLSLRKDVAVKQVLFMPVTDNILACFQDDAMNIWKLETFKCIKQILPDAWKSHHISTIAFTRNGRAMVVGGNSQLLVVFDLDTWCVGKVIKLPEDITGIHHAEFIPQLFDGGCNKILGIISTTGRLNFFNIELSELVKSSCNPEMTLSRFVCSGNGKYLACILHSGEINIHITSCLLENKEHSKSLTPDIVETECSLDTGEEVGQTSYNTQKMSAKVMKQKLLKTHKEIQETLNIERLQPILKEFGEYPESYRFLIWKTILQLPHNQEAFICLVKRGIHSAYRSLEEQYPLENKGSLNSMKRLLSCLAHWSPLFAEMKFLPLFVFPFARIFQSDPLICFEVVVTIIVNWCQHWFEFFPFPPINTLAVIENVLASQDPELLAHFFKYGVTTHLYAWPLLETAFSEVLSRDEWLRLWDHIISNEPSFLLMAVVAYNIVCHKALKTCERFEDFKFFFQNQNALDMKKFISKIYILCKTVKEDLHPRQCLTEFKPLEKGAYPVYNEYPKYVNYKTQQLEEIRREEERILKENEMLMAEKIAQNERMKEERQTRIKEKHLHDLEAVCDKTLKEEEDRLAKQRVRIAFLRKDLRDRQLQLLASTRSRLMKKNVEERVKALHQMLDEIERKRRIQDAELASAEEEIKCHFAAFKTQKENLELQLESAQDPVVAPSLKHHNLRLQQDHLDQELRKLHEESSTGHRNKQLVMGMKLTAAEDFVQRVEMALAKKVAELQVSLENEQDNVKMMQLEVDTKFLEEEVKKLVEQLTQKFVEEGKSKLTEVAQMQEEEMELRINQKEQISKQRSWLRDSASKMKEEKRKRDFAYLAERMPSSASTSDLSAGTDEFLQLQQNAFQRALKVREELLRNQQIKRYF